MCEDTLPPLRDFIREYDLRAKKSFGQNFLLDINLTRRIARIPGPLDDSHIYEVGPGPGGLTRALLLEGAARVSAVEMDARCMAPLGRTADAFPGRLDVTEADALDVDDIALLGETGLKRRVIANLPYNVGTQLFVKWLTVEPWPPWYHSLTLMFQREVAERIVAKPGSKAYGRLSILAQWRGTPRIAMKVPASAFTPPPKVESAIVHFVPGEPTDPNVKLKDLELVVQKAFGQRRKMLRASLKGLAVALPELLQEAAIEETARADALSVSDYVRLALAYGKLRQA